jgi:hypothetical protein
MRKDINLILTDLNSTCGIIPRNLAESKTLSTMVVEAFIFYRELTQMFSCTLYNVQPCNTFALMIQIRISVDHYTF